MIRAIGFGGVQVGVYAGREVGETVVGRKGGSIRRGRRGGDLGATMKGPTLKEGGELEAIARVCISPTPASATTGGKAQIQDRKPRNYISRLPARSPPTRPRTPSSVTQPHPTLSPAPTSPRWHSSLEPCSSKFLCCDTSQLLGGEAAFVKASRCRGPIQGTVRRQRLPTLKYPDWTSYMRTVARF